MSKDLNKLSFDKLTENSADIYLYRHKVHTNVIYIITLVAVAIIIALLPFIYVDITVSAMGNVRPVAEKTIVTASVAELVDSVYVKEGDRLRQGDIILTLRTAKNQRMREYRNDLIRSIDTKISDLQRLEKGIPPSYFISKEIREDYYHYQSQRKQIATEMEQCKTEWERNKSLFDLGLISESEYNNYYYQYTGKKNELATLDCNQKCIWQDELYNLRKERKEYCSSEDELRSDMLLYEIRSPASGNLEQFSGIYKGNYISIGQRIAIISPDGKLCLDVYVALRDIAFIKKGQSVNVQIDALNYNEWGVLHGKVTDISSDMTDDGNGNYYYMVKCSLDNNFLSLRDTGRRAFIKKGMSATAHFIVTRQSLLSLLYKNIDEWANPTQYN